MDILAIIPVFNSSPVCVWTYVCMCVLCAGTRILVVWVYMDSGCVHTCSCTHTEREGSMQKLFSSRFTQPQGMHTHLHHSASPQLFLFYFFLGGGGCILIFSANMHRDLSGVTSFTTKCPTAPAVIPGPSIAHRLQSPLPSLCPGRKRLCVEAPAAAVSHGSTALGFCPPLSCWSSYRNVVSWAATLLLDVNAVGQ